MLLGLYKCIGLGLYDAQTQNLLVMNLNGERSKAIIGKTTLSLSFDGSWWFFGCKIEYNGASKYWTDLQTQKMAEETALQWGITLPEAIKGAFVKITF